MKGAFYGTVVTLRDTDEDADENCIAYARKKKDQKWPPSNAILQVLSLILKLLGRGVLCFARILLHGEGRRELRKIRV